jgi:hypothetical protein
MWPWDDELGPIAAEWAAGGCGVKGCTNRLCGEAKCTDCGKTYRKCDLHGGAAAARRSLGHEKGCVMGNDELAAEAAEEG